MGLAFRDGRAWVGSQTGDSARDALGHAGNVAQAGGIPNPKCRMPNARCRIPNAVYSCLSASMGSSLAARTAGYRPNTMPTPTLMAGERMML